MAFEFRSLAGEKKNIKGVSSFREIGENWPLDSRMTGTRTRYIRGNVYTL